jgi:hypothetical protein
MSEPVDFQLRFQSIELVAKSLEPPSGQLKDDDLNFNYLVDLKLSPEQKLAFVITDVTLLRISDKSTLAYFKLLTVFQVLNFDDVFKKVDHNVFDVPLQLEILLKSAGLSTIRGVIYSELRGTYLNNAILPLIDIASVIIKSRGNKEDSNQPELRGNLPTG